MSKSTDGHIKTRSYRNCLSLKTTEIIFEKEHHECDPVHFPDDEVNKGLYKYLTAPSFLFSFLNITTTTTRCLAVASPPRNP